MKRSDNTIAVLFWCTIIAIPIFSGVYLSIEKAERVPDTDTFSSKNASCDIEEYANRVCYICGEYHKPDFKFCKWNQPSDSKKYMIRRTK